MASSSPSSVFGKSATGDLFSKIRFMPKDGLLESIDHAINSFGFLIARNESISSTEFAQRIGKTYDCVSNPQTSAIVTALNTLL
jgi:hypothetical protein